MNETDYTVEYVPQKDFSMTAATRALHTLVDMRMLIDGPPELAEALEHINIAAESIAKALAAHTARMVEND